jgi:hypothetical protein
MKSFSPLRGLLAASLLAAPAFAQTFAGPDPAASAEVILKKVAGVRASARASVPVSASVARFARSITCPEIQGAPLGRFKIYTGLGGADRSAHVDETRLNDYEGTSVKDGVFHFDAWSCDTQDYSLSASLKELTRAGPGPDATPVVVHEHAETRGIVDADVDATCTANW